MKTLAQTEATNDISIGPDGQLAMSEGAVSYGDIIADRLRTLRGECQLAEERGVPYMETVFRSASRIDIWKHYARQEVESLPFVKSVASFTASYSPSRKTLKFDLTVETDKGEVSVSS